jgi:hypothetical protein
MHRSRLSGFIVDCQTQNLPAAVHFWSAALGMAEMGSDGPSYVNLDARARDLVVEVQAVDHPSRVHLDIETDDIEAEVKRLEQLGARRLELIKTWWVMEAPTGQRFCVVRAKTDLATKPDARTWG